MITLTAEGLEKNSYEENLEYVYDKIRAEKGNDVDLSPEGPWGQFAVILAKFIGDNDDNQEEIYISRDPDNATGVSQDKLSAETGTYRKSATKTVVEDVLLLGDDGTLLEAGKEIAQNPIYEPPAELVFILDESVTISKSAARRVLLSLDDPETGLVYFLIINSFTYTYTALEGDTLADVIAALIALLPSTITGTNENDQLQLDGGNLNFTITFSITVSLEKLWSAGDFTASIAGPYSVPAESLTEIVTPVSGWNDVINPNSGSTGASTESDAQLISRRKNELIKGKGTDQAIANEVRKVSNVNTATVTSNRTLVTVDGIPPKAFETVVSGGTSDDIAQAILDNMPSGIEPFGTESGIAVDEYGQSHEIFFSRPTFLYIHVRFTRTQHPEEDYPDDGDAQVKQSVLDWVAQNITNGTDIVRQRLETPFFEVPGSASVTTLFAVTDSPEATPTWISDAIISVPGNKTAVFSADRIFVLEEA